MYLRPKTKGKMFLKLCLQSTCAFRICLVSDLRTVVEGHSKIRHIGGHCILCCIHSPCLIAELVKGLQHEDNEGLCAFIEVPKIPEDIWKASIGSKPRKRRKQHWLPMYPAKYTGVSVVAWCCMGFSNIRNRFHIFLILYVLYPGLGLAWKVALSACLFDPCENDFVGAFAVHWSRDQRGASVSFHMCNDVHDFILDLLALSWIQRFCSEGHGKPSWATVWAKQRPQPMSLLPMGLGQVWNPGSALRF